MTIQWQLTDNIGWLIIDQPPANTMTREFFRDFRETIQLIKQTPGLKALIIHGKGRHFSSGADIDQLINHLEEDELLQHYQSFQQLEQLDIPVIAAIRGVCLGSALELTLFSHFRICSHEAVLGLPETTFNLIPGIGGTQRLARLTGKAKALELVLHGNTFSASEALEFGVVDALVTKNEILTVAELFARDLPGTININQRRAYLHKYLKPLNAEIKL